MKIGILLAVLVFLTGCHSHTRHYNYTPGIYTGDVNAQGFVTRDYTRNTHVIPRYKYNERYDLNYGYITPKFGYGNNHGNTCKTRGTC